jgi:hypothetical protein
MPELTIEMTKRPDGGSVLRCIRADGSVTWQKNAGRQGTFFPLHDLTHYAVESVLGFREGFFGLLASGWDIEETEGKSDRGPLPPETLAAERIVGAFDAERAGGTEWSADDFNNKALCATADMPALDRVLTEAELSRIRSTFRDLVTRWATLQPKETLRLTFNPPA